MCGVWRGYDIAGIEGGEVALRLVLRQTVAPPYWRSDTHTHTHTCMLKLHTIITFPDPQLLLLALGCDFVCWVTDFQIDRGTTRMFQERKKDGVFCIFTLFCDFVATQIGDRQIDR
jgi:hypothetical protein